VDFSAADTLLEQAVADRICPAAQLTIRRRGRVVHERAFGWLAPETRQRPTRLDSRFDMASVTKLFTAAAFMQGVEARQVQLDQPVNSVLPEFGGLRPIQPYENPLQTGQMVTVSESGEPVDAGQITFRQLLCHNSGLPAWRPLFQQPDAAAARQMALDTFFSYRPGERVVYSDIGLILLGISLERLAGQPLERIIRTRVLRPLSLGLTDYLPVGSQPPVGNVAPTEFCKWRQRRILGEVHDENAWILGGVAAHAGIFSTAGDVAAFGQIFLDGGAPLLCPNTVAEMTRLQAETGAVRRGLGFVLWSPDPEASSNPFSRRAFGHTGFTGTCVWIDPQRELVTALLTNDVYYGRETRGIGPLRVQVHRAVVESVDG
jgi:CubicO group peptidase (beta-lactamase class C family)